MRRTRAIELAARAGYAARGIVYLLVGGFAIDAALVGGGETRDTEQVLLSLLGEPLGGIMLAVIAAGLGGYSLWRLLQAVADVDGHGTDLRGLAVRSGLLISAVTHTALAFFAAQLALAGGGSGSGSESSDHVARVLALPGGRWMVAAVALAIAGAGIAHIAKGWTKGFEKWLELDAATARWASPVCQGGLIARGAVFVVIGGLVGMAAYQNHAGRAGGLTEALRTVQQSPFGGALFAVIAVGLFAFGVYSILEAIHRRVGMAGRSAAAPSSATRLRSAC